MLRFLLNIPPPPRSTLFPYTTLFRSLAQGKPDRTLAITEQLFASAAHVAGEQSIPHLAQLRGEALATLNRPDRKSTRLNSSHVAISYAVFCLKKKKVNRNKERETIGC